MNILVYEAIGKGDLNTAVEDFVGISEQPTTVPYVPRPSCFQSIATQDIATATEDFFGIPHADAQGSYFFPRVSYYLPDNTEHDVITAVEDFLGIPVADAQGSYFFPRPEYYLPSNTEHDTLTSLEDFLGVPESQYMGVPYARPLFIPSTFGEPELTEPEAVEEGLFVELGIAPGIEHGMKGTKITSKGRL